MVKVGGAVLEDTSGVERPVGGVDGDGDRLSTEGGGELTAVSGGDVVEGGNVVSATVELAGLVTAGIRVFGGGGDAVLDDVLEGVVHPTTVASLVAEAARAVDQLLLGKVVLSLAVDSLVGLNLGVGGEGPARSARSLVLNGGDVTLGNPVDGGSGGGLSLGLFDVSGLNVEGEVGGGELFGGQVHELVGGHDVGLFGVSVVGLDHLEVLLEDHHSEAIVFGVSVLLAVDLFPGLELLDDVLGDTSLLESHHVLTLEEGEGTGQQGDGGEGVQNFHF